MKKRTKKRVLTFQIEPLRLIMWVLFQRVPFSFGYGVWKVAFILVFARKYFSTESCKIKTAKWQNLQAQTDIYFYRPKMYRTLWGSFGSPKIGKSTTTPSPKILAANGHTLHFRFSPHEINFRQHIRWQFRTHAFLKDHYHHHGT